MNHTKETNEALNAALSRILSGNPNRCTPDRKLSVSAVEYEAGLGNGSAYYYPEFIQKIKILKKQHQSGQESNIPKTVNEKYKNEKQIKEKYREQLKELRKQLSHMATEHHQFNSDLIHAYKEINDQKDQIAKLRRERIGLVKPKNKLDKKGESNEKDELASPQ
jgi:septal ring factor EnvC (AmiA/AmiB activator)